MPRARSRSRRARAAAAPTAASLLRRLAALRGEWDAAATARKRELLAALAHRRLPSARAVLALHEELLFLRAYADDAALAAAAEDLLQRFARRADFRRHRAALADSGLAGTAIHYPFFYPTALWLAQRFPAALRLDWTDGDESPELSELLLAILPAAEAVWLRERRPPARRALAQLAGRGRGDAAFLLAALAATPGDEYSREAQHDGVSPDYVLLPGPGTPNRTLARASRPALGRRAGPPSRRRPDLAAELVRPPRAVRAVGGDTARALVTLARDAMVTRARDLDCFCYGDARDVRRVLDADGLELVAIGSLPSRRLLLSTAYGLLILRSGVPTGYVQLDAFLATALVHFNTFETFRGADAAWVFARVLAAARQLFGARAFAIEPYQLGKGNDEALDSGAWWFYTKLGFRPRDPAIRALARREAARLRRTPGARSPRPTLAALAEGYLFWEPDGTRAVVPPHAAASRAISAALTARPTPRAQALGELVAAAVAALGPTWPARPSAAEALWLERWAPLLVALPGLAGWSAEERAALAALVRAKAGRRESDVVPLTREHPRFAEALLDLVARFGAAADVVLPRGRATISRS